MASTVLQNYFTRSLKEAQDKFKKVFEMSVDLSVSKKPIELDMGDVDSDGNPKKRKMTNKTLRTLATSLVANNSKLGKIFKLANKGMTLRFSPTFLTPGTIAFLEDAKGELGNFNGKNILKHLTLVTKYGLIDQRGLDVLWNVYVNNTELYKNATQNEKRRTEGKTDSRQYIAPDARMKKMLRKPLQNLVDSFKGTKHKTEEVNFVDGKETVAGLRDFKFFHFSRVRKGMIVPKENLTQKQKVLISKPENNKVFKEYEKIIYEKMAKSTVEGGELGDDIYIEAVVQVSQIDFKVGKTDETYKIGPYSANQVRTLKVGTGDGFLLSLRSVLDTERMLLKKYKETKTNPKK